MKLFVYTIFLSAFLLFQIQPLLAKFILPWYGGSAAVWSACMLFFQAGLLIGYGYAHLVTRYFSLKNQIWIHLALLLLSLISIPVTPHIWPDSGSGASPTFGILALLSLSVGFPYILVSTTGPLLQHWFSFFDNKKSPYRLYALSNLGSLVGLFTYPLIVEPIFQLKTQTLIWSCGYVIYIVLCAMIVLGLRKIKPVQTKVENEKSKKTDALTKILWLLLAFMGTVSLLSVTNKLTQDVLVVPFLWIIPLALYLVSFIIAFENPKWYNRKVFLPALVLITMIILKKQYDFAVNDVDMTISVIIILYSTEIFLLTMVLHGELARIKPDKSGLTFYYFLISAGGVFGGVFITLIVPFIFRGYWEIYTTFIGTILLITISLYRDRSFQKKKSRRNFLVVASFFLLCCTSFAFSKEYKAFYEKVIYSNRNFYGVLKVMEADKGTQNWQRLLFHGDIMHGMQFMDTSYTKLPTAYYGPKAGMGLALSQFPTRSRADYKGMKVGMIGLGTGTICIYGTDRDLYKFYEINPLVYTTAKKYFTYLSDFKGKLEVEYGDGRINLENELKEKGSNNFDILAVDAFSGDAIPTHLLTKEAGEIYLSHLKPEGILAFNITNKYLNLLPVLSGLAESIHKPMYYFFQESDSLTTTNAIWVLLTENPDFINNPVVKNLITPIDAASAKKVYWTDNYSSILSLFWENY